MGKQIDFYYEFSSPYACIGAHLIEDMAANHGADVIWRPFMLGAAFKGEGTAPLVSYPKKGAYALTDIARTARLHGIPFRMPDTFPQLTVNATRIAYWAEDQKAGEMKRLSMVFFKAVFQDNQDISNKETLAQVCEGAGLDWNQCLEVITDPVQKQRLKEETQTALDRGVFGAPFFFIDDEPFWGVDRLPQMEKWLETGGW